MWILSYLSLRINANLQIFVISLGFDIAIPAGLNIAIPAGLNIAIPAGLNIAIPAEAPHLSFPQAFSGNPAFASASCSRFQFFQPFSALKYCHNYLNSLCISGITRESRMVRRARQAV